jgi:hypothetical protein
MVTARTTKIIVPSRAYLTEARTMARKMRHLHATVSIDPSRPATVRHHLQAADVSVTFGGFGQAQVIPVPPNAVPEFIQGWLTRLAIFKCQLRWRADPDSAACGHKYVIHWIHGGGSAFCGPAGPASSHQ